MVKRRTFIHITQVSQRWYIHCVEKKQIKPKQNENLFTKRCKHLYLKQHKTDEDMKIFVSKQQIPEILEEELI